MTALARFLAFSLFVAQGVIGGLTLVQPFAAAPALFQTWAPPLVGVRVSAPTAVPSFASVTDASFQRAAEAWVGDHLVQRPAIVRAFNQALWQVFSTSYMASRSLVRGKDGVLFERSYILAHCGIILATNVPGLPDFAYRLRKAEDWFQTRGRRLVYFMAPVKTSWFPDLIPARFPCPVGKRDQVRQPALAALSQANVDFVDGRAALEAQRAAAPVELFPRNGIHWNWLGAAIGADALLRTLNGLGPNHFAALKYDVHVTGTETGADRDLSDLLNLLSSPAGRPAPVVTVVPAVPAGTLRLVTINDSFFEYLPTTLLNTARAFQSETVFGYLTLDQRRYADGGMIAISEDSEDVMRTVYDADVVVLEEVESRVGGPYALQFLHWVEAAIAREQSATTAP